MDPHISWFLFLGFLLLFAALSRSFVKKIPLTTGILYFLIGVGAGPYGLHLLKVDVALHSKGLEIITEIAVVVSLFTAGLKLHVKSMGNRWKDPLRLATIGMVLSVIFIALILNQVWGYAWGAALLFGSIISPTDPVLASDVQVEEVHDRDRLRFSLTGEGCLNDGTAFPFVMLALGLLGLHNLGEGAWRWLAVDVVWATLMALAIGYSLGDLVGRVAHFIHRNHGQKIEAEEFLALGLIALSYGIALLAHSYGFLAVFASGFALRNFGNRKKRKSDQLTVQIKRFPTQGVKKIKAKVSLSEKDEGVPDAVLSFNEGLERILEITVVVIFGAVFNLEFFTQESIIIGLVVLLLVRPLVAWLSLYGVQDLSRIQRNYILWFGVRGVGSLYYYFYAVNHGLDPAMAKSLLALTYVAIFMSLFTHGFSVTPLMKLYGSKRQKSQAKNQES